MLAKEEFLDRMRAIAEEARRQVGSLLTDHYKDGGYEEQKAIALFLTSTEAVADLIKQGEIGPTHRQRWFDAFREQNLAEVLQKVRG